jgi:hypothetical protein
MMKDRNNTLQTEKADSVGSSRRFLRLEAEVFELQIDLTPPRLIRIVGMTSNGTVIERHIKITEKQKMLMV